MAGKFLGSIFAIIARGIEGVNTTQISAKVRDEPEESVRKGPRWMATPQPSLLAGLFCMALFFGAGSAGAFAQTLPSLENG
ncbi:MAG TPA: hypothetical protein VG759_02265, partial [Candidatus Angelobacter sp.]|nr:hypothetical protein [Candidatus Angelobacter sp.]